MAIRLATSARCSVSTAGLDATNTDNRRRRHVAERDLEGKVALVVGAGVPGGIGEASAHALGAAGARVMLSDLPGSQVADVAKRLLGMGIDVAHTDVDIRDEASVQAVVQSTVDTFGRLDVLDNNAAATNLVHLDGPVHQLAVDVWDETLDVNARGLMLTCKHTIPVFLERGGGSIVNISAGKALRGDLDEPAYSASKAALNSLTRTIAVQYGKQNIRCNAISTGVIQTALMKQVVPPDMADVILDCVLTPHLGEPSDIANMVAFLASDRARYITGQVIQVDGGILDYVPVVPSVRKLAAEAQNLRASEAATR
jgi:NAD(P)-dependent dehydrogenase (short-subunit alcohol dehydrogenase family)